MDKEFINAIIEIYSSNGYCTNVYCHNCPFFHSNLEKLGLDKSYLCTGKNCEEMMASVHSLIVKYDIDVDYTLLNSEVKHIETASKILRHHSCHMFESCTDCALLGDDNRCSCNGYIDSYAYKLIYSFTKKISRKIKRIKR